MPFSVGLNTKANQVSAADSATPGNSLVSSRSARRMVTSSFTNQKAETVNQYTMPDDDTQRSSDSGASAQTAPFCVERCMLMQRR